MKAAFVKASLVTAVLTAISLLLAWGFGSEVGKLSEKLGLGFGLGVDITLPFLIMFPPLTYIFIQHNKLKEAYEDLEKAHSELQARSRMDHMTGLLNREALFEAMKVSRSRINTGMVLVVDADHFKSINDTYGHGTGDRALKLIAFALQNVTRKGDLVGRIGGEEFCVFLPSASLEVGNHVAERIRAEVENTPFYATDNKIYPLTISVGVAVAAKHETNSQVLSRADRHLYMAKQRGRNCVVSDKEWDDVPDTTIVSINDGRTSAHY